MDAFELAVKYEFNVVISELFLPEYDGSQLVMDFRKLPYGKESIFFFVTNPISEDLQVKCIEDGADDVIIKPIKPKIFKSKVESVIKRFKAASFIRQSMVKRNINMEIGEIIFCKAPSTKLPLKNINLNVQVANSFTEFTNIYKHSNIWMVFIDNRADWALNTLFRIIQTVGLGVPVWLVTTKNSSEKSQKTFIENGGFGVFFRYKKPELLDHQINVLIEREISIKNQYINTIKHAVKSSPVHFAPNLEESFPSYTLKARYEPYTKPAGGDFYEIVKFDNGNTLILLGDVMGKRWGAWFFANAYLAYIRASLRVFPTQKQVEVGNNLSLLMEEINQFLYKDIQLSDAFTTLLALLVIPDERKVKVVSAGAINPIFYSNATKQASVVEVNGKILGITEYEPYKSVEIPTVKGDKILLVTDGFAEAFDSRNEKMIGIELLAEQAALLLKKGESNLEAIEHKIIDQNHIENFHDDRTMILLEFK